MTLKYLDQDMSACREQERHLLMMSFLSVDPKTLRDLGSVRSSKRVLTHHLLSSVKLSL